MTLYPDLWKSIFVILSSTLFHRYLADRLCCLSLSYKAILKYFVRLDNKCLHSRQWIKSSDLDLIFFFTNLRAVAECIVLFLQVAAYTKIYKEPGECERSSG